MPSFLTPLTQALPSGLWVPLLMFVGVLALVVGVLAFARHADDIERGRADASRAPPPPARLPETPVQREAAPTRPAATAAVPSALAPAGPRSTAAVAVPPPAPAAADAALRPLLLVADDSAVARAKLRRLLEGAGYEVDLVEDGAQALEKVATRPYAVLITDLEMPVLDGFQLIAHVQGSLDTEDLPVIAITGHEELSARVHDCQGLFGIFKKPWNDRELLKRVNAVAALRGSHAGA